MNGKVREWALAIGALALIACALSLLVDARAVREVIAAANVQFRDWRAGQEKSEAAPEPRAPAPAPQSSAPLPPPDGAWGRAPEATRNKRDPGAPVPQAPRNSWITSDDYPAEALRNGWQGRVSIEWSVDETGRAQECRVTKSSGHAVLDEVTCGVILRRARYFPAVAAGGKSIASKDHLTILWRLPD